MNKRKTERLTYAYTFGTRIIYIATGMLISLTMLLLNEKLFNGSAKEGDPLLVVTLGSALLGGILLGWHREMEYETHEIVLFGYLSIGLCIGVTIIGTIYDGQAIKWFAPIALIVIPTVIWMSQDKKKLKESTRLR